MSEMINAEHHKSVAGHVATEDITFGYCTEIMVALKQGPTYAKDFDYDEFRNYLNDLGILSLLSMMMKLSKSMSIQKIQDLLCKKVLNMVAWSR